jgi:hypothetical protein
MSTMVVVGSQQGGGNGTEAKGGGGVQGQSNSGHNDLGKSSIINARINTVVVQGHQSLQRQRLVRAVKELLWSMDSSLSWVGLASVDNDGGECASEFIVHCLGEKRGMDNVRGQKGDRHPTMS